MTPNAPAAVGVRSVAGVVPDPTRVLAQLFVPGHALAVDQDGRTFGLVDYVMQLTDEEVDRVLDETLERFAGRHRDLTTILRRHADRLADHVPSDADVSDRRRLLLGASFTQEYAVEAAAVCNPSLVQAPDQAGLAPGELRTVLSVRQIGEGHRSSIGFRTVVIGDGGDPSIATGHVGATAGTVENVPLEAKLFDGLGDDDEASVTWVLDALPPTFDLTALVERVRRLEAQTDTRRDVAGTSARMLELVSRCYATRFPATSALDERTLTPACAIESHGLEDARFVRFTDADGSVVYHAPYTAYDGTSIAQQLLTTTDFEHFTVSPLMGPGAANKGLALFPRRIRGRFHALSRSDGRRNAITQSDDIRHWPTATPLDVCIDSWSSVQLGNSGSPIELDDGWLVLTHGVGAMRTYSIGALLLDLDDPTIVLAQSHRPLIVAGPDERDGYVPNVVYSCGAVLHRDHLVVPVGIADQRIGFSTFALADVLATLREPGS